MAKVWNRIATACVVAALPLTLLTLQGCKFRSLNGSLNSEPGPGDKNFTGLDLQTRGGRTAEEFFRDVNGAVYIGEIIFSKKREKLVTNNASFFEGKAIETVLADLEKSLQPGQTPQHFAFKGCKKERQSEINNALLAAFKSDKTDLKDAFIANYSRVWKTENLEPDQNRKCLETLLSKQELEFSFFIKPPEANEQARQLLVVRAGNDEKPAVFESLHPIPKGKVIVILRNDSWGRARPKMAILPSDREFDTAEQTEALFAHGWPKEVLALRDNALADAIAQGRPKSLVEMSARFAALSHYGDIGGAAAKVAIGAMIFWGFGMAATTTPAIVHAVSTAMTTHTFSAVQFAPVVPFVAGVSSGIKGICDLTGVSEKARLEDKGGVWKRREKYCFIINLIFIGTTAAQALATTPMVRQAIGGAFQAALAQAPSAAQNLSSNNQELVMELAKSAESYHRDINALLDSLALGLTNLQAVGYAQARILFNAIENISSQIEKASIVHSTIETVVSMKTFLERSGYRCNADIDLQQLKLGNNLFTRMLAWPGCFKFLRAAYIGKKKQPGAIDDEKLWSDFAASDPLNEGVTKQESVTAAEEDGSADPIAAAAAKARAAGVRLKQIITGEKGKAELLRSADQEPWKNSGKVDALYNELGRKIWKDIETCETELRSFRDAKPDLNLCGPKQFNSCIYKCARSALHQIRNTYFPIEFLYCLETKEEGAKQSCTFKYDMASDDGFSMRIARELGTVESPYPEDQLPDEDEK